MKKTYRSCDRPSAIADLQRMLGYIARRDSRIPFIAADGIFDEATGGAVERFCLAYGLKPRRYADLEVFYAVREVFDDFQYRFDASVAPDLFPSALLGGVMHKGDRAVYIYYLQGMLIELGCLCDEFASVALTGVYDDATEAALRRLRAIHGVGADCIVDRETWNELCLEYNRHKESGEEDREWRVESGVELRCATQ